MSSTLRASAKRLLPVRIKHLIKDLREMAAPPPIDDVVLTDYRFAPDQEARARLNFVIPNLTASTAFGGVMTGIDIFIEIALGLSAIVELDLRVILAEPDQETDNSIMTARATKLGLTPDRLSFLQVTSSTQTVLVRQNDIFVSYSTWMTLNLQPLIEQQAAYYGNRAKPLVFLIQEYEPQLYPFSSAHMLMREGYDRTQRLWGVFNSSNLHWYFGKQGHEAERAFVFEPVISDKLRPYLDRVETSPRAKRILVYGRPGIARNCFPAIVRGLRRWVSEFPRAAEWEIVSAGTAHKPIDLGRGLSLASVGKLSLDKYAETLLSSSVGLSLMASPHPSYPPLEMAHMGLRAITNSYFGKDLAPFHANIRTLDSISERNLAASLAAACGEFGDPVNADRNSEYVRSAPYPFLPDICSALAQETREAA